MAGRKHSISEIQIWGRKRRCGLHRSCWLCRNVPTQVLVTSTGMPRRELEWVTKPIEVEQRIKERARFPGRRYLEDSIKNLTNKSIFAQCRGLLNRIPENASRGFGKISRSSSSVELSENSGHARVPNKLKNCWEHGKHQIEGRRIAIVSMVESSLPGPFDDQSTIQLFHRLQDLLQGLCPTSMYKKGSQHWPQAKQVLVSFRRHPHQHPTYCQSSRRYCLLVPNRGSPGVSSQALPPPAL